MAGESTYCLRLRDSASGRGIAIARDQFICLVHGASAAKRHPAEAHAMPPQGVQQERRGDRARTLKYGTQLFRHFIHTKALLANLLPAKLSPSERATTPLEGLTDAFPRVL